MRAGRPLAARAAWQAWRWSAAAAALARRGRAFLPRALDAEAAAVGRIGERRALFRAAGTGKLRWLAGSVVGGDWDLAATGVEEHPAYRSFAARFFAGVPWQETEYRRQVERDVAAGVQRIGCRDLDDVARKFASFDRLWEVVGTSGYRPDGDGRPYRPWEEVLVGRARDGGLVLVDGRHRLILAHLKRSRLPVFLVLRHPGAPRRAHSSR